MLPQLLHGRERPVWDHRAGARGARGMDPGGASEERRLLVPEPAAFVAAHLHSSVRSHAARLGEGHRAGLDRVRNAFDAPLSVRWTYDFLRQGPATCGHPIVFDGAGAALGSRSCSKGACFGASFVFDHSFSISHSTASPAAGAAAAGGGAGAREPEATARRSSLARRNVGPGPGRPRVFFRRNRAAPRRARTASPCLFRTPDHAKAPQEVVVPMARESDEVAHFSVGAKHGTALPGVCAFSSLPRERRRVHLPAYLRREFQG